MNEQREKIMQIEQNIIEITGDDIDSYTYWDKNQKKRHKVEKLLIQRQHLLNDMFIPSEDNMKQFIEINDRLYSLTCNLFSRIKAMNSKKNLILDSPDFDDDYEIEGTLKFSFNGEDSVLSPPDDSNYGSNFTIMIKNISDLSYENYSENIEHIHPDSKPLDDGVSWYEYPFNRFEEFQGIIICHAVHHLTDHQLYSIPDLLRLNDFLAEINFKVQSITDQQGNRYKDFK